MLFRKISKTIEDHLKSNSNKILLIDGARQIGKTYIVRYVGKKLFANFIEINFLEDKIGNKYFENIKSVDDFYLQLSLLFGDKLHDANDTLIFLDEIQAYPHFLTLLKFLNQDHRFTYICSGSLLGVTLSMTTSIPMGSIKKILMYPLDFEEFLLANGLNQDAIDLIKKSFINKKSLPIASHDRLMYLFKMYLLIGGLPDAVNLYLNSKNIHDVREYHEEVIEYYGRDASNYDSSRKLKITRIYNLIPSNMENKKKRFIYQDIENIKGKTYKNYEDEFEYLINAGIALDVRAVSNPSFPLTQSESKNLIKLYMNDVGLLTSVLFKNNIKAILEDTRSINLGSLYENVVACELKSHGHKLFYYDNRKNGEVDYLIDDYDDLSVLPIEVKSGRDYTIHSALNKLLDNNDYHVKYGIVLSNDREVKLKNKILYLPIYYVMFL